MALMRGHNNEEERAMHRTRLIMASMIGGDPRNILPLPMDGEYYENIPLMGTLDSKKLLKRAGKFIN